MADNGLGSYPAQLTHYYPCWPAVKLSVSVPADLWVRAMETNPGLGASQLVQEALTALIAETDNRPTDQEVNQ